MALVDLDREVAETEVFLREAVVVAALAGLGKVEVGFEDEVEATGGGVGAGLPVSPFAVVAEVATFLGLLALARGLARAASVGVELESATVALPLGFFVAAASFFFFDAAAADAGTAPSTTSFFFPS